MTGLLLATTNRGKQGEFRRLLADLADRMVVPQQLGLALNVAEPHDTYAENASAKAVAFCRASGLPTLADDSGIEVAALGWGPGVRTARFAPAGAGAAADYLLARLGDDSDRRARMVCWLALAVPGHGPDGTPRSPRVELFSGVVEGSVAAQPRGSGGFGYDPIFQLDSGQTTAELADADKDRISHRGRAMAAALPHLRELLTDPA